MNETTTALIAYPLSQAYREQLETVIGQEIEYVLISELRQSGWRGLIKGLRAIRGQLLLPLEDPSSAAILPILQLLALCAKTNQISIVKPDCSIEKLGLSRCIRGLFGCALASIENYIALFRANKTLKAIPIVPKKNQNNKHILYLNTNLWFGIKAGGSVGHIAGVCNALIAKGYTLTYAAVENNALLSAQAHFHALPTLPTYGVPYELNNYRFDRAIVKHLSKQIIANRPDFIYQRLAMGNMTGAILAKRFGIPLIIEYNGSEAWIAKHWGHGLRYQSLAEKVEACCLNQADLIVTISDVLRDELLEREIAPEKIVAYPNGIDAKMFDPNDYLDSDVQAIRTCFKIPNDGLVATFLGTFGRWHGVDVLADAICQIAENDPDWLAQHKLYFLFVGDGLQLPQIKARLANSAAMPYCRFVGLVPQKEAPYYLAASDILLSPHKANDDGSRFFGSPTKLFEYMAMSKAIIASDLEQVGQVLMPGIHTENLTEQTCVENANAILCRPGDPRDIVKALKFVVNKPHWRTMLGQNARQKVLTHYTWSHHVDEFLKPVGAWT